MSAELTTDQKRDVVLAAVIAAGPGANDNQVASQVTRILGLTASGSVVMNAFDRAAARAEKTTQVDHFNGDLIYVDLEETSQRPVYFFRTSVRAATGSTTPTSAKRRRRLQTKRSPSSATR